MARTRSGSTALAALAAVALSACGAGHKPDASAHSAPRDASGAHRQTATPPPTPTPTPTDREQIESLLRRRASALAAGDASAYAATATGRQRVRDRLTARRTHGLGIIRARFVVSSIRIGGRRARLRGRSAYELSGVSGRFSGARRVLAVRTGAGWRIAREASRRERHPWELGRFTRSRSGHFVVLTPAGLALPGLSATLEAGYRSVRAVIPSGRLRRRYLVVVAGSVVQARRLTRSIQGVESLAAITDAQVREAGPARRTTRVVFERLMIVWPVMRRLDPDGRRRIVAHELTHAALAGVTSGRTPSWLVEGMALYVSGDRRVAEAAAALRGPSPSGLSQLGRPDAIARLSGVGQGESYALASAATEYLAERFGRSSLLRFFGSFNDETIAGRAGRPQTVDRALRKTLGIGLHHLERALRRWIARQEIEP